MEFFTSLCLNLDEFRGDLGHTPRYAGMHIRSELSVRNAAHRFSPGYPRPLADHRGSRLTSVLLQKDPHLGRLGLAFRIGGRRVVRLHLQPLAKLRLRHPPILLHGVDLHRMLLNILDALLAQIPFPLVAGFSGKEVFRTSV
jgi:hypothetical protein